MHLQYAHRSVAQRCLEDPGAGGPTTLVVVVDPVYYPATQLATSQCYVEEGCRREPPRHEVENRKGQIEAENISNPAAAPGPARASWASRRCPWPAARRLPPATGGWEGGRVGRGSSATPPRPNTVFHPRTLSLSLSGPPPLDRAGCGWETSQRTSAPPRGERVCGRRSAVGGGGGASVRAVCGTMRGVRALLFDLIEV